MGNSVIGFPPQSITKTKKGVKRKADTTTPSSVLPTAPYDPPYEPSGSTTKPASIPGRRESSRQIKRPKKDLPDDQAQHSTKSKREPMSEELKYCHAILKELFAKKHSGYAWPFYKPVDANLLGLTDYHEVIKKPMDLGTVKRKVESNDYASAAEFAEDTRLIFTNCYRYNPPESDVVMMAKKLQDVFEMKYARMPDEPIGTPGQSPGRDSFTGSVGDTSAGKPQVEDRVSDSSASGSSSDSEDSEAEREKRLKELQEQLRLVQEQLGKLTAEHVSKAKEKKE